MCVFPFPFTMVTGDGNPWQQGHSNDMGCSSLLKISLWVCAFKFHMSNVLGKIPTRWEFLLGKCRLFYSDVVQHCIELLCRSVAFSTPASKAEEQYMQLQFTCIHNSFIFSNRNMTQKKKYQGHLYTRLETKNGGVLQVLWDMFWKGQLKWSGKLA